jgi:membrane protein
MEGLRRARDLPVDSWTFWQRRRRAFELVPLSLIPLTVASLLVVFGHAVTGWLAAAIGPEVRASIYTVALLIRWTVALGASVCLTALIYHLGVPTGAMVVPRVRSSDSLRGRSFRRRLGDISAAEAMWVTAKSWRSTLPGAVVATAMWFLTTLAFGWYVTRFANYSEVYGSLGAGIALLFWLYIISLSVLCGAEFNAQLDSQFRAHFGRAWGEPAETSSDSGRADRVSKDKAPK